MPRFDSDDGPRIVERQTPVDAHDVAAGLARDPAGLRWCRRRNGSSGPRRRAAPRRFGRCVASRTLDSRAGRRASPRVEHLQCLRHPLRPAPSDSRPSPSRNARRAGARRAGCAYMNALVRRSCVDGPPSIAYAASVNGAPPNPMRGTRPASSRRSRRIVSSTWASASRGSKLRRRSTSRGAPDWMFDRRPFPFDEIEFEPHGGEGQQQIGEQDCGVDLDGIDRLQSDGDSELRLRDYLSRV